VKIPSIISNFVEKNQLDSSLEEVLRKYEDFRASRMGYPKPHYTEAERIQARKEVNHRSYLKRKMKIC
jgi:hypothetical protein